MAYSTDEPLPWLQDRISENDLFYLRCSIDLRIPRGPQSMPEKHSKNIIQSTPKSDTVRSFITLYIYAWCKLFGFKCRLNSIPQHEECLIDKHQNQIRECWVWKSALCYLRYRYSRDHKYLFQHMQMLQSSSYVMLMHSWRSRSMAEEIIQLSLPSHVFQTIKMQTYCMFHKNQHLKCYQERRFMFIRWKSLYMRVC